MPLIYRSELPNGLIALWKIDESETELRSLCTPQERIYASERLTTGNRRKEWLAWHALLHETTPQAETGYDPNGAPVLKSGEYIGVSHTKGYAAVIIAKTPCAVDIELRNRNFLKAAPKYLSPDERQRFGTVKSGAPNKRFTNGPESPKPTSYGTSGSTASIRSTVRCGERSGNTASHCKTVRMKPFL